MLRAVGHYLIVDEGTRPAEAVVVLSGDYGHKRLDAGLSAVHQSGASSIIVLTDTPEDSPDRTAAILRDAERRGVEARRVIVASGVRSTVEDARRAADVMQDHGWRAAIVVTSPYHTRRAASAFHHA